ncbi:RNB-domain-containing protein [Schizopora paradoxa]|uniref:RNB-domain-containing protein n=1 Tax=Schizopora paradoxa TaxID=27342 RepID=A0A0H2S8G9_9AGAM|nr:RNB-domain-containing protein [Schizopora paradoxa]
MAVVVVETIGVTTTTQRSRDRHEQNIEDLENMGKILTKAIRSGDSNPGHHHTFRRHRRNVNSSPPPEVQWRFPSIEKKQFTLEPRLRNASLDEAIQSSNKASLQPGSFVELRRHELVRHAVVLANMMVNQTPALVILLTTGETLHVPEADVMFTIPHFIDTDMARRCGPGMELDAHKLAARQAVVKRAREFERAVEEVYNGISWEAIALYSRVKPQDDDEWGEVSTIEAARILHIAPNPPIITLFAVHKHLMNQGDKYVAQSASHRQTNVFAVRPPSHVAQLKNVRKWIHDGHPLLDTFAERARKLIDKARELEKESADEIFSKPVRAGPKFNSSEREIIRLLQLSLDEFRTTQVSPYAALVPIIIKKIDRYEGDIKHWTVLTALREMGVHEPWEDMVSKNRDLMRVHGAAYMNSRTGIDKNTPFQVDPHESVRHDFGQLPVFVVDDHDAEELDDGISFETDPNDPSASWVHVHVADPTAILSPTHPIAQTARKMLATTYFVYDTWPMLPPSVGHTGLRRAESDQKAPQNVLTFSMKLNSEGDILDYKIRPGVVRNVTTMRYDDVDAALGLAGYAPVKPFEVSEKSPQPSDTSYIQPHIDNLRQLWKISEKQVASRTKRPIFTYTREDAHVSMSPKPGLHRLSGSLEPMFYRGFPQLSYTVYKSSFENGARSLVGECMKLACRVASRFCFEHNIPMFRRASSPLAFDNPADLDKVLAMRNSRGEVKANAMLGMNFASSPAEYTLEMKEHWAMGIGADEGYMRATSPLRRYQDMVAHWQIKSALLPSSSASKPPFSESDVLQIASELTKFEGVAKRLDRRHRRFWTHYYIYRYMQHMTETSDMPDPHPLRRLPAQCVALSVKEHRTMTYHTELFIPSLGLSGDLISQSKVDYHYGDQLLVNVKSVEMHIFPTLILEPAS